MQGRAYIGLVASKGAVAVIVLLFAVIVFAAAPLGLDEFHDGLTFKAAFDIASGIVLPGAEYSQYGPLFNSVNAFILWLSGLHFVALKFWAAGLYVASLVLVCAAAGKASHAFVGLAAALVYVLLYPFLGGPLLIWAPTATMLLTLLLALLLLFALQDHRAETGYAAGVVVAGLVFVKISVGVTLAVSLAGATAIVVIGARGSSEVRDFVRTMRCVFVGLSVVLVLAFAYLLTIGALGSWVYQNITLPATMADFIPNVWYNRPNDLAFLFSRLFPLGIGAVWLVFPILVCAGSVVVIVAAVSGRVGPSMRIAVVLAAVAGGSWAQYYPVVGVPHAFWSAMPMLPLLGFLLWQVLLGGLRLVGSTEAGARAALSRPVSQIAVAVLVLAVGGFWFSQSWQTVACRADQMRSIAVAKLAVLEESNARASDLERLEAAIRDYARRHGPVRLVNLTMNALYSVLAPNPANWSRVPILYALYTEGDPNQSLELAAELAKPEKSGDPRLIYSNGYGYFVPPFHTIAETSQGGLLLAPGAPKVRSDLPDLAEAGLGCGKVELHSALVSPYYAADPRRFWGYFMPPIHAPGPVLIDILVRRRKEEGPNSVMIDAHIDQSSPRGFSIRRFANRGDAYFLTEWLDGRPEPLIGLDLTPEVIHHIQLRHMNRRWTVYLDGKEAGSAPSKLASLRSDRAVRLGAGHRFIDSLVGEIIDWRVIDLGGCTSPSQLPPPSPDIAVRANSEHGRFAASLSR